MYLAHRNQNWLPEVFNTLFSDNFFPRVNTNTTAPAINVIEKDGEYDVELAAPGMTREDFAVTLDEDQNLVVDLEKKVEAAPAEGEAGKQVAERYLRREFSYTKFHQTLLLPDDVDRKAISAICENGVLTVRLPKLTPEQKAKETRRIEIQ